MCAHSIWLDCVCVCVAVDLTAVSIIETNKNKCPWKKNQKNHDGEKSTAKQNGTSASMQQNPRKKDFALVSSISVSAPFSHSYRLFIRLQTYLCAQLSTDSFVLQ